jgi:hypothetical protein
MAFFRTLAPLLALAAAPFGAACSSSDSSSDVAHVQLMNDFNDPQITTFQPPWTICKSSYQGIEFGKIELGKTSDSHDVPAGLDYLLMVAAWDDPTCEPSHCLPIATKNKEEVVSGQTRTIAIAMTNHQGPCPPEGVPPIPQEQYDRIVKLWPEYGFKAYADRAQNAQCAGSGGSSGDGGTDGGEEAGADAAGE